MQLRVLRPAALAMFAAMFAFGTGATETRAETLVLGTVGKDVKSETKEYEALAGYLQGSLSSVGVDKVEIKVLPTADKMSEAIREGAVHLYFDSPVVAAKVGRDGGAVPMVRRWRKGVAEYWGEVIVLSEAPIHSLDGLRGRVIAFEDPDSTTGHLLQRALLIERGLQVEGLKRPDDPLDPTKVGAIFTQSDKASILSLFAGRVAAVATDSQYLKRIEEERPGSVRSIGRSIAVPRQVVMRAAAMPEARVERIAEVLKDMTQSDAGREVLMRSGKTDRFDSFPQGIEATFAPIHAQLRLLEAESGSATGTQ